MGTAGESGALGWVSSPAPNLLGALGPVVCLNFVALNKTGAVDRSMFLHILTCPPFREHGMPSFMLLEISNNNYVS